MSARDYDSAPASDALGLREIIRDLAADISDLRAGTITVDDAFARAAMAKQLFNGVRLYIAMTATPNRKALPNNTAQDDGA